MKLYISRHGQTPWNVEDLVCGRADVPLTEVGLQQAQLLAESAMDKGLDVILCSPLQRARQTAQAVSDAIGVPIQIDERLVEIDFGTFDGTSRFGEEFVWVRAQMPPGSPAANPASILLTVSTDCSMRSGRSTLTRPYCWSATTASAAWFAASL